MFYFSIEIKYLPAYLIFSFAVSPTNNDDDDDDNDTTDPNMRMGSIDPTRARTMPTNRDLASKFNKWMEKKQSNCK